MGITNIIETYKGWDIVLNEFGYHEGYNDGYSENYYIWDKSIEGVREMIDELD